MTDPDAAVALAEADYAAALAEAYEARQLDQGIDNPLHLGWLTEAVNAVGFPPRVITRAGAPADSTTDRDIPADPVASLADQISALTASTERIAGQLGAAVGLAAAWVVDASGAPDADGCADINPDQLVECPACVGLPADGTTCRLCSNTRQVPARIAQAVVDQVEE